MQVQHKWTKMLKLWAGLQNNEQKYNMNLNYLNKCIYFQPKVDHYQLIWVYIKYTSVQLTIILFSLSINLLITFSIV